MKPLTIEQLKALEVGDWVWIVALCEDYKTAYVHLVGVYGDYFIANYSGLYNSFAYSDYGKTWLAYKNKEQEECKGEYKEYSEIYDYLYDYLNNAATCITQKDTNVVRIEVDAWLEFDLIIDLSAAKYFDDDTMTWKELRGAK